VSTSEPGELNPESAPRQRRRRRRADHARHFTGAGRHVAPEPDVLAAIAAETAAAGSAPALPGPVPAAARAGTPTPGATDEFDVVPSREDAPARMPDDAPPATPPTSSPAPGDGLDFLLADTAGPAERPLEAVAAPTEPEGTRWLGDQDWLASAQVEANAVEHHGTGYADALARFDATPAGYLPAEDLFSEQVPDMEGRRRRRRRSAGILVTVVLVVLLALGAGGYAVVKRLTAPPEDYPGPGTGQVTFTVGDGWGSKQIGRSLLEQDIIKSTGAFDAAVDDAPDGVPTFHPGDFQLAKQMAAKDVVAALTADPAKVSYVALEPNARLSSAISSIAEATGLSEAELSKLSRRPKDFGLPATATNLEGWLHPGAYRFPLDASAKDVLTELVDATKASLEKAGLSDPVQQQRALIVASIVSAEGMQKDYAKVAGVIENRLAPSNKETNGLLQSDATVIYGLNRFSLRLSREEQRDASNPYNTYVHKGLPPTPIGSPGNSAIEAAAHPEASEYYYWVTVNLDTGETLFARTHAEHVANVAKYSQWCSENPGRCQ